MTKIIRRTGDGQYQLEDAAGNVVEEINRESVVHPTDWGNVTKQEDWNYIDSRDT